MTEKQILDLKLVNDIEALKNEVAKKIEHGNPQRFVEVNGRDEKFQLAIENNKKLESDYYAFSKKYFDAKEHIDRLNVVLDNKKKTMLSRFNGRIEKVLTLDTSSGDKNYEYTYTLIVNGKRYLSKKTVDAKFDEIQFISDAVIDARYDFNHQYTQRDVDQLVRFENDFLYSKMLGSCIADIKYEINGSKRDLEKEQQAFKKILDGAANDIIALKCATVFNNNKQALTNRSTLAKYEFDKALGAGNRISFSAYFDNFEANNEAFETATKLHNINVLANITTHEWKEVEDFDYINSHSSPELPAYLKRENGVLYINPALCEFGELSTDLQIATFETAKIVNIATKYPANPALERLIEDEIQSNIWLKDKDGKATVDARMIANYSKLVNQFEKK